MLNIVKTMHQAIAELLKIKWAILKLQCLHGNPSFLPYSCPILPFIHHTVISLPLPFSIFFTLKQFARPFYSASVIR